MPAGGLVEEERARKEPAEIAAIRAAAALTDEIYEWVAERGRGRAHGARAGDRARARDAAARRRARRSRRSSPRASTARSRTRSPRDVPVAAGVLVTLDIGARVDGYCSDCTRTWATGALAGRRSRRSTRRCSRREQAGVAAVRPGPTGREVDAVARDVVAAAGHGEHFGHGLGHGVGLEIHEAPRLAQTDETPLAAGQVVTVEPGVYVPGLGGARVEDLVLVTEDGHEVLSGTTRAPRVVA